MGNCPGFVGNRLIYQYSTAAAETLLAGALPEEVDAALEAFGMRMGPFRMADMVGLDLGVQALRKQGRFLPESNIKHALIDGGRLGQKSGGGYYDYADGRTPTPSATYRAVAATVRAAVGRGGVSPGFGSEELQQRLFFPLINEGFKVRHAGEAPRGGGATRGEAPRGRGATRARRHRPLPHRYALPPPPRTATTTRPLPIAPALPVTPPQVLEEGHAQRPSDIDVCYVHGYGFPRHKGGPMHHADAIGLPLVAATLREVGIEPAALLQACIAAKMPLAKYWPKHVAEKRRVPSKL